MKPFKLLVAGLVVAGVVGSGVGHAENNQRLVYGVHAGIGWGATAVCVAATVNNVKAQRRFGRRSNDSTLTAFERQEAREIQKRSKEQMPYSIAGAVVLGLVSARATWLTIHPEGVAVQVKF